MNSLEYYKLHSLYYLLYHIRCGTIQVRGIKFAPSLGSNVLIREAQQYSNISPGNMSY